MTHRLDKCDGPACPGCGCEDVDERGRGLFDCRHCGRQFAIRKPWPTGPAADISSEIPDPDAAVIYDPIRCPRCRSSATLVVSTRLPLRRHKCEACGHPFKSIERC